MAETEGTIDIEAGAEEIMEVIADFEAYPEWSDVKSAEVVKRDGQGRGAEVAYEVSALGMSASYTLAYAYKPKHAGMSWTTRSAKGAVKDIAGEYVLDEDDGVTTVTYRLAVEPAVPVPGFMKRQAEKRVIKQALEGLKRRVEEG